MILGIVGHEEAKFTNETRMAALQVIRDLLAKHKPTLVVSGRCPLGGVDIWAIRLAGAFGIATKEYAPEENSWDPPGRYGFKARNLDIAKSDHVACIVVAELPESYKGRRFFDYHCKGKGNPPHIKSGGCWTAWKCPSREWRII